MSDAGRLVVLGPLLAALVAASGIAWGLVQPPPRSDDAVPQRATEGGPEVRALLGGLSRGDTLVGWRVTAISGPDARGTIRIELSHRQLAFSLLLSPKGAQPEQAPVQTEHWSIFYGHVFPPEAVLSANVIRATTNGLANRVREHE
ncbi:MAG: hypothetical protein JKY37_03590 [Nannocystaceae bacterium]|nr:hypothetical protein [Nannocystaceae bacterium]